MGVTRRRRSHCFELRHISIELYLPHLYCLFESALLSICDHGNGEMTKNREKGGIILKKKIRNLASESACRRRQDITVPTIIHIEYSIYRDAVQNLI